MILLRRIKSAGSEDRIRSSQFGFRKKYSTMKALAILRKIIDSTIQDAEAKLHIVFLDWARAFDRIKPEALILALKRFGIDGLTLDLIRAIYEVRTFCIQGDSANSSKRRQETRITQGCSLSPYLFIIGISILMQDSDHFLNDKDISIA